MPNFELNPFHDRKMHRVGETTKGTVGEPTASRGDLFRFDDTTDTWYFANHTSEANAKGMLGLYLGGNEFLLKGTFKTSGLNKAATYFVGPTDGSYSNVEPNQEDYVLRVVGYARNAKELIFNPDDSYYTLGADSDDDTELMIQTLGDILTSLKKINLHMTLITDVHLRDQEVD